MNFIYSKHRLFLASNIREQNQDDKKLSVTMTWIAEAKSFEFACVCVTQIVNGTDHWPSNMVPLREYYVLQSNSIT